MTTATLLGHYEPGSEQWLAARHNRLGASEIAAVVGLSPWMSPFSLWHAKKGNLAPQFETGQMAWGKDMEEVIAKWYQREHPEYVVAPCGLYVNTNRDYQVAQPDRALLGRSVTDDSAIRALLEIKTARLDDKWGKPGTDDIPVYYRCQGLWQADCLGIETVHFAVSISGAPPVEYTITWDESEVMLLREAAEKFIESLKSGEAPDLDGHDATYRAVRDLHPEIDGTEVQISEELAAEYRAACENVTDAAYNKQAVCAQMIEVMGSARYAKVGERKIARREAKNGGVPYLKECKPSKKDDAR